MITIHNRTWAVIPLLAMLYSSVYSIVIGRPADILWVCNLCNALLAFGLWRRDNAMIWIATLWLCLGTPLWIWDILDRDRYFSAHAIVIHVVSALIGILAIRKMTLPAPIWWQALLLGLIIQVITRFAAPPEFNINVSAYVYPALQKYFSQYWQYMIFNGISFALSLFLLEWTFRRWWCKSSPVMTTTTESHD